MVRTSISIDQEVLDALDKDLKGYRNRSHAIESIVRDCLIENYKKKFNTLKNLFETGKVKIYASKLTDKEMKFLDGL